MVSSSERTMNSPPMDSADFPRRLAEALQEGLARAAARRAPGHRADAGTLEAEPLAAPALRAAPPRARAVSDRESAALQWYRTALASALAPVTDARAHAALIEYGRGHLLRHTQADERPLREAGVTPYQLALATALLMECVCLELVEASGHDDTAARAAETVRALGRRLRTGSSRRREDTDCCRGTRRRIARDLHDHVGAALAAARSGLGRATALDADAVDTHLREAEGGVREILHDLRDSLAVPTLRDALDDFVAAEFPPQTPVSVKWTGNENLLSETHRRGMFITVREALRNSLRHAPGSKVAVTVRVTRRWAHAAVGDDGPGFDTARELTADHRHLGIRAMSDRMEDLGGRLTVTSTPGQGTRVDVQLPLRR
ncbi:ATP-binding protein [Streptomyces sp. NPDC047525]|uniref:sensor histidine kinase n=1 Tax=Streptomyces sp. NPDC047525 TaxID=3155264 RepID=UPI0033D20A09